MNQEKLIKQGIKYTDALFQSINNKLLLGIRSSDTLEAFLEATKDLTVENPLVTTGYTDAMSKIILLETNNHKFSRPAQKELVRTTIENMTIGLLNKVGEDLREDIRTVVKEGYDNNLTTDEIGNNISSTVTSIKNKRARSIARTEIARTATISDYIINKERGATHFYVECRNTACPICKNAWHEDWSMENDESFSPNDSSAGGKGWIGDKTYSMEDTSMLPPIHPNCRCVPYFVTEKQLPKGNRIVTTTKITNKNKFPEVVNSRISEFDDSTKNKTKEQVQVFNEKGDLIYHNQGDEGMVSIALSNNNIEPQLRGGHSLYTVHNHPSRRVDKHYSNLQNCFSAGDLLGVHAYGMEYNNEKFQLFKGLSVTSPSGSIMKLDLNPDLIFDKGLQGKYETAVNNLMERNEEFNNKCYQVWEDSFDKELNSIAGADGSFDISKLDSIYEKCNQIQKSYIKEEYINFIQGNINEFNNIGCTLSVEYASRF